MRTKMLLDDFDNMRNRIEKELTSLNNQNDALNKRIDDKNKDINEHRQAAGKLYFNFDRQRKRVKSLYKMLDRTNLSKLNHDDAIKLLKNVKHAMSDIAYSYSNEGD